MFQIKRTRLLIFAGLLVLLFLCMGLLVCNERRSCMNVPVVSQRFLRSRTEDPALNISEVQFNGQRIGAGSDLTTIYISQPVEACEHFSDLLGSLTVAHPGLSLYFLDDPAIQDVGNAVQTGTPLSMIVSNGASYRRLNVIVTTLPVLYLEQQTSVPVFVIDREREVKTGSFVLLGKAVSSSDDYRVETGITQWHPRGGFSSYSAKTPLKLSLKDNAGEKANHNLLHLGSDDDWILNPMNQDDTKVREKVMMTFWNGYIAKESGQYPMSTGEYIEVIVNNEYQGLFLLQRRVDRKYLDLDQDCDILLKGTRWGAPTIEEGYDIIYSPYDSEKTYQILADVLLPSGGSGIDLESFLNTTLYLNCFSAGDNEGYKNMFYVLRKEEDHYILYFVPWDTDLSMGLRWVDGFVYDYDTTLRSFLNRQEYTHMKELFPQLDELLSARWQQSREEAYSMSVIGQLLEQNIAIICGSGAYSRDVQRWGLLRNGQDTHSALLQWCDTRLSLLDIGYGG